MPYNSSSFQKQLNRHRSEQAARKTAAMPSGDDDRRIIRARMALNPDGTPRTDPLRQTPPAQQPRMMEKPDLSQPKSKKKWGVLLFWIMMILPALLAPVLFKGQMEEARTMLQNLQSGNGSAGLPVTGEFGGAVQEAARKAAEVTAQGPEMSMKYIEEESKRLDAMAKEFDAQHGK